MRAIRENILASIVTLIVVVFFFWALIYPLSYALVEAVREPIVELVHKGDTWQSLSEKTGVSEKRLKSLNPTAVGRASVPAQASASVTPPPPENFPLVIGHTWTLQHIARIFDTNAAQWRWIINSLLLAAAVTFFCATISYPLAWLQARTSFWMQGILGGLLLLPLVMPPFVGAIGLRRMLAKFGTINLLLTDYLHITNEPIDFLGGYQLWGCVLVMVLHFYPLLYLNLAAAISNIDPALLEASKSLGLTPWQTFRRVVLPLSWPGLVAGGSLVFIGAFTDLGTPLVFGYQDTIARQIFALANEQTDNPLAPALVAVVTAIVLALFGAMRWSSARIAAGGGVKGQTRAAPRRLSPKMTGVAIAIHLAVISIAILPHLAVTLNALGQRWFLTPLPPVFTTANLSEALSSPLALMGMRNSLLYSLSSTLIDLALGLACAWTIVRGGRWWGRAIDSLSLAPLAIPGLVLAFGYVGAYAGFYSKSGAIVGVGVFLILSYAVRRLPYVTRACVAGLEQTPRSLEEAASGLGATPSAVIRRITLPLIWANVVAGGILAFSFAMLEVSDSIILAQRPQDFPLTKSIYQLFGNPGNGDQLASALGLIALIFLSVSLLAAAAFLGKKWGEMFRA
ncbi:MAG TPA: iron ABC transporter permease [Planctomycetota bacterium]|jgi:iron(III) transport system permease protein